MNIKITQHCIFIVNYLVMLMYKSQNPKGNTMELLTLKKLVKTLKVKRF